MILADTLMSFVIILAIMPLMLTCLSCLKNVTGFSETVQDQTASLQLQRILLLSDDIETDGNTVTFTYSQKQMELHEVNGRMIISPGTQIFFSEIRSTRFFIEENFLITSFYRGEKEYEYVLTTLP